MKRVKLVVAYDGTNYCGWQVQKNGETIESVLNRAIGELTGEEIHVMGSSRTDAGVHAYGQVIHFDLPQERDPEKLRFGLDTQCPDDIDVVSIELVSEEFHARYNKTN